MWLAAFALHLQAPFVSAQDFSAERHRIVVLSLQVQEMKDRYLASLRTGRSETDDLDSLYSAHLRLVVAQGVLEDLASGLFPIEAKTKTQATLFSQPGLGESKGEVARGEDVVIAGLDRNWARVHSAAGTGWIIAGFLSFPARDSVLAAAANRTRERAERERRFVEDIEQLAEHQKEVFSDSLRKAAIAATNARQRAAAREMRAEEARTARREALFRSGIPISLEDFQFAVNPDGGLERRFHMVNVSEHPIVLVDVTVVPYDSSGNAVVDPDRKSSERLLRLVGPVEPGEDGIWRNRDEPRERAGSIVCFAVKKLRVEFQDGTEWIGTTELQQARSVGSGFKPERECIPGPSRPRN